MSNLLLFKVPLLIANTYAIHAALTPPNTAPSKKEVERFGKAEPWLSRLVISDGIRILNIVLNDIAYLGEAAVILALRFPENALSKHILTYLPSYGELRLSRSFLFGTALLLGGAALRVMCFRQLGKDFTFELTVREDHKLVTGGPYAYVRHPSYLGVVAMSIGTGLGEMGSGSWWKECCGLWTTPGGRLFGWPWCLMRVWAVGVVLFRAVREDQAMKDTFGKQWVNWAVQTPYKMLPGLW